MTAFRRTHGSARCEEPGLTHQLSVCLGPRVGEKTLTNNECKKAALQPERGGSARHVVTQEQGWTLTANYEKPLERERVDPPSASRAHREDSSSAHELERLQPVERCCGKWDVPDYCGHGSSAFHTADRHRPSCVHLQETGSVSRLLHSAKHHRGLSSGMEEDGRDQHRDKEGAHWRTLTTDLPHEETPDRAGRVPLESPCRPQRDTTISEDSVEEGTKQKKRAVKKKTAAVRAAPETSSRVLRPRKQLKVEPTAVAEEKSRKRKYVKQRAVKSSTGAPEKKRPGRKMTPLLLEIPPELLKKPRVKTDFHCAVCGRTFPHAYKLERHQLIHTGERPYCCSICGRGFNQKGNLKTHYKVHLGHKGSLDYDDLSPISPDLCEYLKSLPGESRVSSLRCLECGKDCESQSALQAHHITMHSPKSAATEPPFYFCRRCGIEFKEKYQLEDHMKTHVKEKPYSCPDCGKRFINQNYIAVHQRIHTGERPYLCSQCGRGFHTSSSLKLHETQHSGERPFGCSVCGKRFRVKSYLSTHYQTHLNDRPFICSVCGKGYSRAEELKVHSRLHTGERPYRCGECGKSFIYRQGLRQHQRTHAGRRMGPTRQLGRPKQQARLDS